MQQSQPSATDKATEDIIGLGWRMCSLTQTADVLLSSALRLGQEVQRETTYWQEVLAVNEAGWSLCRVPRERNTLGVRFGFNEGTSPGCAPVDVVA